MNQLAGKKILIMDNSPLGACAVKRAKELGIKTIVANWYPYNSSPSKQVADEWEDINISDIDNMVNLIKAKQVDGVFVSWTDSHLPFYVEICERAGLPCCGNKRQFEQLSNDKRFFKETCLKYGVPTMKEYSIDINFRKEDLESIKYPVMVKPADGSGGRGVKKCDNEQELIDHYKFLYDTSSSKKIICEEYIESDKEIYIHFMVQDREPSFSDCFMKHKSISEKDGAATAILHVFPSSYIDLFRETTEKSCKNFIKSIGIENGMVLFQGFIKNNRFYFYESGLRMGGSQSYIFTQALNGISALDMMIEFALTGKITSVKAVEKDNPKFPKFCCNYYISLKPGVIKDIYGFDKIRKMPQILQIISFKEIGDTIKKTNSVDRIIYRIHVMDDTQEQLASTLERISSTIRIISDKGEEMQIEKLTYDRAYQMIRNS